MKHLIFEYVNVAQIWKAASKCLNFDIKLKDIVVRFYLKKRKDTKLYNYFFFNLLHIKHTNVKSIVDFKKIKINFNH